MDPIIYFSFSLQYHLAVLPGWLKVIDVVQVSNVSEMRCLKSLDLDYTPAEEYERYESIPMYKGYVETNISEIWL